MREHDTLQAAMRFGRDGNGAVVYVHTDTLPEWVPITAEARVVSTWSDGMKQVVEALGDAGDATTAALVDHPAVDLCRRQVYDHLETLRQRDVIRREQDADDGRRTRWYAVEIGALGSYGDVTLSDDSDEFDPPAVSDLESSGATPYEDTYTWEFRNLPGDTVAEQSQRGESTTPTTSDATSAGDPPPT
jgi:hypothetical protein